MLGDEVPPTLPLEEEQPHFTLEERLFAACETGDFEEARTVIEAKANVNETTSTGQSPVVIAARNDHATILRFLIIAKADATSGLVAPINEAAAAGALKTLRVLTETKADINHLDFHGKTPLACAAENGKTNAVRYLLEAKAKPFIQDMQGHTPVVHAKHKGRPSCIAILDREERKAARRLFLQDNRLPEELIDAVLMRASTTVDSKNGEIIKATPLLAETHDSAAPKKSQSTLFPPRLPPTPTAQNSAETSSASNPKKRKALSQTVDY